MSIPLIPKVISHVTLSLLKESEGEVIVNMLNFQVNVFAMILLVIVDDRVDDTILPKIDKRVLVQQLRRPPTSRSEAVAMRLNRILTLYNADIIHAHQEKAMQMLKVPGIKKFLTMHAEKAGVGYTHIYSRVVSSMPGVAMISGRYGNEVPEQVMLHNGVDAERMRFRWIGNFKLPLRIIQIGKLQHHVKGQHILLQAMDVLKQKYGFAAFELHFVGDGPSRLYLHKMAAELDLHMHCSFHGEKSNAWVYENLCDYALLVHPSQEPDTGCVITEAMAAHVLCLVADLPQYAGIIDKGRLGYSFEKNNVTSCANAIMQLLQAGDDFRQQMREAARAHVQAHYSMRTINETYMALYNAS